jgi:hypothetical protein
LLGHHLLGGVLLGGLGLLLGRALGCRCTLLGGGDLLGGLLYDNLQGRIAGQPGVVVPVDAKMYVLA